MSENNHQAAKVSGSALLDEMSKQTALLTELNQNIVRLLNVLQSNRQVAPVPAAPPHIPTAPNEGLSLKEQIDRYRQANPPPQPVQNPQQAHAAQQAAAMYPGMSTGNQHQNITTPQGDRVSGVDEPAWMNHLTPIDKSQI
jgi:hypothetical protein